MPSISSLFLGESNEKIIFQLILKTVLCHTQVTDQGKLGACLETSCAENQQKGGPSDGEPGSIIIFSNYRLWGTKEGSVHPPWVYCVDLSH